MGLKNHKVLCFHLLSLSRTRQMKAPTTSAAAAAYKGTSLSTRLTPRNVGCRLCRPQMHAVPQPACSTSFCMQCIIMQCLQNDEHASTSSCMQYTNLHAMHHSLSPRGLGACGVCEVGSGCLWPVSADESCCGLVSANSV